MVVVLVGWVLQAGPSGSLLWDLGVLGRFLLLGLACSTFDQYDSVRAMAPFATWSVQQVLLPAPWPVHAVGGASADPPTSHLPPYFMSCPTRAELLEAALPACVRVALSMYLVSRLASIMPP